MVASQQHNKVLLAGLLGLAAGMLLAPYKGSETRDKLKKGVDTLSEKAMEQKDTAKRKIQEMRGKKDKVADQIDSGVDRMSRELES